MAIELPINLKNPALLKTEAYVHGNWISASSGLRFDIEDPGKGEVFASCPDFDSSDVDNVVQSSYTAFQAFRIENPRSRAEKLLRWDRLIRDNKDDIAQILTYETGKPLAESYGEIEYATGFTWWFAGEAERIRGNISVPSAPNRRVFVVKQPIGVCAALVPWNFSIAMILRKVGAALAAGCTIIAKPSPETPLTTLMLAKLATDAGFGPGVFNVITTSNRNTPDLSETLCKHALVKKVSFTGSTAVGSIIVKNCAEGLKKVTLELGGNCPFIVFDDCDQDHALAQLQALKWRHAGQACVTANRVYVQAGIYEEFIARLDGAARKLVVGHGLKDGVTMGPLTTSRGVAKAHAHVQDATSKGATVVFGGKDGKTLGLGGHFFEPTVLRDVTASMSITQEETFSPVLAVYRFDNEDEVVKYANDTSMGLASYFFTNDVNCTWRMLENLEAGMIGMNTGNSSAAETPFGGMKASGYGKESGKDVAVEEYLVSKTGTLTLQGQY
ncbi:hypothetical protein LTR17_002162 [Elasticomyces elasticus]|nr:hypothetical protein LTR17_002162 [Elasticomyces elasticus]